MGLLDELLSGLGGGAGAQQSGQPTGRQPTSAQATGGSSASVLMALMPVVVSMLASRGRGTQQAGLAPTGGGGGLADVLGGLLGGSSGGGGGLGGLLEQLQRAGCGEQAKSWVGKGQNLPISPDLIGQIFGQQGLSQIARHAGVSDEQAARGLSQLLPDVVDHVTPEGRVPDVDSLQTSVADLCRRLGVA